MNVHQKLFKAVSAAIKEYGVEYHDINLGTNLVKLGLDSLDQVQMIIDLENEFDISIDDTFAEEMTLKIVIVRDILEMLHDKYGIIDIKEERKNKIDQINESNLPR